MVRMHWQPTYKETMIGFARETPRFVRFVNMLINDSIYAMDEALAKLVSIRSTQAEIDDEATWRMQDRRQRQQRLQAGDIMTCADEDEMWDLSLQQSHDAASVALKVYQSTVCSFASLSRFLFLCLFLSLFLT